MLVAGSLDQLRDRLKVNVCVGAAGLVFSALLGLTLYLPLLSQLPFQAPCSFRDDLSSQ